MVPERPSDTIVSLAARLRDGQQGDPALTRRLDEAFGKQVRVVMSYVRGQLPGISPQEADELVQDVLLVAWRQLPEFRGDSKSKTWLYGIASNVCANRRRKHADVLTEDGWLDDVEGGVSALVQLARDERVALLQAAAASVLDAEEQEIVYLRYGLDVGLPEIARDLGLGSPDAVRVALQRCKRRLEREVRRRLELLGHGSSFVRGEGG